MPDATDELSRTPVPDPAEDNAYFPSPYSLSQYVPSKTDFTGVQYENAYTGGRWKILMIATEERYMLMQNDTMFSTGNHPVEMLLPLHHLKAAGFGIDVATVSGNPAKLELWAMPREDQAVLDTYAELSAKLKKPQKLSHVIDDALGPDSDYLAVFIPGGHGVLLGIPDSEEVRTVLDWALEYDKYVITLCHGPGALLAAGLDRDESPFRGYSLCVFPDALDTGVNIEIGYIPGKMPWLVGENLRKQGVTILNTGITGQTHSDRKLLTGDSPLASNNLGLLAAETLVKAVTEG
ncbi:molecular chaperone Hsp31 and glyoxalase 3 [Mycobacteroides abscessus]|uniref:glyoxalase III HchA n=1 Tax=Mycobacteroides abscessus TaxID=36809 RepID=UPI0002D5EC19|nr:glyoxalase III HchA [Mycobacteroides abscessus]CPT74349.1 molecular chaperone Hsp31 and glyoxalase 3 [Mycobacteroides abscessus]CPU61001.1 molecular chaperone Hsp31 and glyoxalase 3 [Mycobacteroides abscessus]SKK35422.1 molecular chaperone Hsp31 and glyoxalase 3 [Mycobacteroides abscessus subsp. massiliense]SKQ25805.1 molecular chaperone Hsp31 and glyoxalase 3 [Mycobacteroides abscessus subsp. massiliense]SKV58386.1 molecular chaperone Hsp31 and glyoxalase 3 [Mycobacteroides abscessus subsp